MEQQRVLVDEAQGDKFGEASGLVLDVAQQQQLANPVVRSFSMAVHHRGGGAEAGAVRMTSIHCAVDNLWAERMWRIASSRISAAVPGSVPRPLSRSMARYSAS